MSNYDEAKAQLKDLFQNYSLSSNQEWDAVKQFIAITDTALAEKDKELARLRKEKETYSGIPAIVRDALKELVELKRIKDAEGKTDDYLKRQPMAWAKAEEALNE